MPEVRKLVGSYTYDPDTLDVLSDVLAETWTEVGHAFETPALVEGARNSIATTLLYHARLGLRDPNALKALVMQSLRHLYPNLVV